MDLLLGFTTYRMQVCMVLLPYLVPHKNFIFCREEKKRQKLPWRGVIHIERFKRIVQGT
jgi:hypothetical protein